MGDHGGGELVSTKAFEKKGVWGYRCVSCSTMTDWLPFCSSSLEGDAHSKPTERTRSVWRLRGVTMGWGGDFTCGRSRTIEALSSPYPRLPIATDARETRLGCALHLTAQSVTFFRTRRVVRATLNRIQAPAAASRLDPRQVSLSHHSSRTVSPSPWHLATTSTQGTNDGRSAVSPLSLLLLAVLRSRAGSLTRY